MKRNKILSSAFVMTMVSFGAFGADAKITEASTCTVDVLGVSDNNAVAKTIATWDLIDYTLNPGQYLNVTETSVDKTTCPAGSYCVGGGYTVETADNSIAQCPTNYPSSDAGAGAQTQCYTACTVATANIAHATAVGGNDYYGTGVDTCGATACETGYHVDGGGVSLVEKDPLVSISLTDAGDGIRYVNAGGTSNSEDTVDAIPVDSVTAPNTWATAYSEGVVYGKASCQPSADPASVYTMNNFEAVMSGSKTMDELRTELTTQYGEAKANSIMDFFELAMSGAEDALTNEANFEIFAKYFVTLSESPDKNYATDSTGQYCYCQLDGFMPTGGTKEIVTSAPWVFHYVIGSAHDCAVNCANICAYYLRLGDVLGLAFRGAVVGSLGAVSAGGTCAANTINIKWDPANGNAATANQCTYDGEITLPTPDPVKPGYTFTGWKLLESSTTE